MESSSSEMQRPPRQRDLWMVYVAQLIIGPKPKAYPDITGVHADMPDNRLHTNHDISAVEKERIRSVVQQYLPCPASQMSQATTEILKLCTEGEQYPYDLVIHADRVMNDAEAGIARVVCGQMFKIYDTIIEERTAQRTFRDDVKTRLFSLRRVLARFCEDSETLPPHLFIEDIDFPAHTTVFGGGAYTDVYCIERHSELLALKYYRVFEKTSGPRHFSKAITIQAILLFRLKHENILPFLGLYTQRRKDIVMTYIVSPWMNNGDITHCMGVLTGRKERIPRIRWIYEVACGLRYLHDECIVHGDLHANNLLVDNEMHVCITDFGFADLAEPTTTAGLTPETARGVSWYSAPELLDEDAQPNYASDVWSFGCVSLLIWTGEGPYNKSVNVLKLLTALMNPGRTPEDPGHPMDTFYEDQPEERSQGAFLREQVAQPCWSREPEGRPTIESIVTILRDRFEPF